MGLAQAACAAEHRFGTAADCHYLDSRSCRKEVALLFVRTRRFGRSSRKTRVTAVPLQRGGAWQREWFVAWVKRTTPGSNTSNLAGMAVQQATQELPVLSRLTRMAASKIAATIGGPITRISSDG